MLGMLKSSVSGMVGQNTKTGNIAHNISNVNTPGYKKKQTHFSDLIYQQEIPKGNPVTEDVYTGSGSKVDSTAVDLNKGALKETGRSLDLSIRGEGFFGVEMPDGTRAYTRCGSFNLDSEGNLVTSKGNIVSGDLDTIPQDSKLETLSIDFDGTVKIDTYVKDNESLETSNPFRLQVDGGNYFGLETEDGNILYAQDTVLDVNDEGQIVAFEDDYLLTGELERVPDDANLETLTITSQGEAVVQDENGEDIILGNVSLYNFENSDGLEQTDEEVWEETEESGTVTQGYAEDENFGSFKMFDEAYKTIELGQLHLYQFDNPVGLSTETGNLLTPTEASGPAIEGVPSEGDLGELRQGILEESNVNLAEEMQQLILSQRYFQLNSRSVRTADELWSIANNIRR